MKAKVLKYKSDGNTIESSYMELEPYAENIYTSLLERDQYADESKDLLLMVCKIGDIYFACGKYLRQIIEEEGSREEAEIYCKNWVDNTIKKAEEGGFISILSVHVFDALGLDSTPLKQAREAYAIRQEQQRLELRKKEEEERKQREKKYQLLLDENKRKFLEGEMISGEMFLEITRRDGFDIHIRTKGAFNRHVRGINKNGTISYRNIEGCRTPYFTGCHKAASDYLSFIITNRNTK